MTLDQAIALFAAAGGPDWATKALLGLGALAGGLAIALGIVAGARR